MLFRSLEFPGARPDADIIAELARHLGATALPGRPDDVLREITRLVPGYSIQLATVLAGGAAQVGREAMPAGATGTGRSQGQALVQIQPAGNTLFTSGTMGKYSKILSMEAERRPRPEPAPL